MKCDRGCINLRFLPPGVNLFIPLSKIGSISKILGEHKKENGYFGVATHIKGHGTKEGILQIPALWVDVDLKGKPYRTVWKRVNNFKPRPSAIIKTGGGYHVYWFLKKPTNKKQIPEIESLLKRLASALDGDMNATDASRILRIPGTLNLKPKRNRFSVHISRFKPERRYRISDFDFLLPIKKEDRPSSDPSGWTDRVLLDGISEGERNNTITRLAGRYIGKDLTELETKILLMRANSKSHPPLDKKEVLRTLHSIHERHLRNAGQKAGVTYQLATLADIYGYSDPKYLIDSILPQENLLILGGNPKIGKSFLAMSIAKAVLTGNPLWGRFPVRNTGPVIYVDLETSKPEFKNRFKKMKFDVNLPISFLHLPPAGVRLDKNACFKPLMEKIEEVNPVLIIIDSLTRVHRQRENDSSLMSLVMERLRKIVNYGVTVLVIHHHRKERGPRSQMLRGSSDIQAAIDLEYALKRDGQSLVLECVGSRSKPLVEAIKLKINFEEENIEVICQGTEMKNQKIITEVKKILSGKKEMGVKEISQLLKAKNQKFGKNALRDTLKEAAGRKELIERTGDKGAKFYRVNSASQVHDPI